MTQNENFIIYFWFFFSLADYTKSLIDIELPWATNKWACLTRSRVKAVKMIVLKKVIQCCVELISEKFWKNTKNINSPGTNERRVEFSPCSAVVRGRFCSVVGSIITEVTFRVNAAKTRFALYVVDVPPAPATVVRLSGRSRTKDECVLREPQAHRRGARDAQCVSGGFEFSVRGRQKRHG